MKQSKTKYSSPSTTQSLETLPPGSYNLPPREHLTERLGEDAGRLIVRLQVSSKLWSLLSRLHYTEWMGIVFFRMLEGSLEKPKSIVVEVIDFLLMDIGSTAHTQFQWGSDVVEYYEQNPHLMGDGIRTGALHSHHRMDAFYSGEDVDDLVVNTKDKTVDYYITIIINNDGKWISRIGYRMQEEVKEKVRVKFWNNLTGGKWKGHVTRTRTDVVLCMIPLLVEDEGQAGNTARLAALNKKKEETERASRATGYPRSWESEEYWRDRGWQGANGKQIELPMGTTRTPAPGEEEEKKEEATLRAYDILMGRIFAVNMTYEGGLDAAVRSFRKKVVDQATSQPLEAVILIHCESVCANARKIIESTEGYEVTPVYVLELLEDLENTLIEDYMEGDEMTSLAVDFHNRGKGEIEIFVDALSMLTDQMDLDTTTNKPQENGNTTHHGEKHLPRSL